MAEFPFRKRKVEDAGVSEARDRISNVIQGQQDGILSNKAVRRPSWVVSTVPFIVLIAVLVAVIRVFGADSLAGGSQVALIVASAVIVAISMAVYGTSWQTLEDSVLDNIRSVGSAILILFLIGAIAGTWMVSGIVPTLDYLPYCLFNIISPLMSVFVAAIGYRIYRNSSPEISVEAAGQASGK